MPLKALFQLKISAFLMDTFPLQHLQKLIIQSFPGVLLTKEISWHLWVQERLHHLLHLPHHHHKAIPSLSIVIIQLQLVLLVQLLTWIFFNHCQSVLMGFLPILSWDIIIFCCSPDQSEGKPSVRIASLLKIYSPY